MTVGLVTVTLSRNSDVTSAPLVASSFNGNASGSRASRGSNPELPCFFLGMTFHASVSHFDIARGSIPRVLQWHYMSIGALSQCTRQ